MVLRVLQPSISQSNMNTSVEIPAAKLIGEKTHIVPKALVVDELFFQVPLDYASPSSATITLFARRVRKHQVPLAASTEPSAPKPYLVYLEGGPGFGNSQPQNHGLTSIALEKGYQVLFLDHRGTGLSTPVSAEMLRRLPGGGSVDEQVDYLKLMRQDNTVRDCEAVRKCLTADLPEEEQKWSTFGQSYGGFVTISYLTMHPEGLRECFLTGGLAPVGQDIRDVYAKTFQRTAQRNEAYFTKFPEDQDTLRQIKKYLDENSGTVALPGGGRLTFPRLMTLGIAFGGHGGFDQVHAILLALKTSLDQLGYLSRASLSLVENFTPFDDNIIYAILHEAIYMDGQGKASAWAAQDVGSSLYGFSWLKPAKDDGDDATSDPLFFSAEHIFPMHFETFTELRALREVAEKLAQTTDWPPLYAGHSLKENTVPVYAASYVEDLYVDYDFARHTASMIRGIKTFETNVMYHNALRAKSDEVLRQLFSLREQVID